MPKESAEGERRVALIPDTVRTLKDKELEVAVEPGAGDGAGHPDPEYDESGASLDAEAWGADVVVKVAPPSGEEIGRLRSGQVLIGFLEPLTAGESNTALAEAGVTSFAMEAIPRITRAQSMDALSSQANVAGYAATLLAAREAGRFFPMMTTAAGTVAPAKVLVLGAGVAGLQAIATAKRLGAVIEASDVRPAVKEQVESLGAKFLEVPYLTDEERQIAEGAGGYARPMPPDWMRRQAEAVRSRAIQADVVITTALIPGRPAPRLIKDETVRAMKPGSVIVDLAVEQGGNVEGIERGRIVARHGVKLVGIENLPATVPFDASALYARNLYNFLVLMLDPKSGEFKLDREDEVIAGTLACIGGATVRKG